MRTIIAIALVFQMSGAPLQLERESSYDQCMVALRMCNSTLPKPKQVPASQVTPGLILWASTFAMSIIVGVLGGFVFQIKVSE